MPRRRGVFNATSLLLIPTFLTCLLSFFGVPVFADDELPSIPTETTDSLPTLQVTPTQQELRLNSGDTYTGTFTATNFGTDPLEVKMVATPYSPADEDYNPDFVTANSRTAIANWVTFTAETLTLAPNEPTAIAYTIQVPDDVPAGGQYAALFIETTGTVGDTFAASGRVGMLLLAQVAGDTRTAAELLDQSFATFNINSAPSFQTIIKNTGNIDFRVASTLKIRNVLNNQVVYDNSSTPNTASILPDTTRLIALTPDSLPALGIFEASYDATYLDEVHNLTQVFVIIPLWLVFIVVFVAVLLLALIISAIIRHRYRKRLM